MLGQKMVNLYSERVSTGFGVGCLVGEGVKAEDTNETKAKVVTVEEDGHSWHAD